MSLVNDAQHKVQSSGEPSTSLSQLATHDPQSIAKDSRSWSRLRLMMAVGSAATVVVISFMWMVGQHIATANTHTVMDHTVLDRVEPTDVDSQVESSDLARTNTVTINPDQAEPTDPTTVGPPTIAGPDGQKALLPELASIVGVISEPIDEPVHMAVPSPALLKPSFDAPSLPDPPRLAISPGSIFLRKVDIPGITEIKVDAIIWSADNPVALINSNTVTPGAVLGNVRVVAIETRRVKLQHRNVVFYVRLP